MKRPRERGAEMQDEIVGFVLRDPLGRQPDQPITESLSLRAKLSGGAIFDLALARDGTALMIRMLPGSGQSLGYADLGIFPQVSKREGAHAPLGACVNCPVPRAESARIFAGYGGKL